MLHVFLPAMRQIRRFFGCQSGIEYGVIRGTRAVSDPIRLGRDHVAFVEVKLSDTRAAALEEGIGS